MFAGRIKAVAFLWLVFMVLAFTLGPAAAAEESVADLDVKIYYNQNEIQSSVPPRLVDGRVLISVRPFLQTMGSQVHWDGENNQVVAQYKEKTITIHLDDGYADIDGFRREMDPPAQVIDGSSMVPLRFLIECLDLSVHWNGEERAVEITSKNFVAYTRLFLSGVEEVPGIVEAWVDSRRNEPGVDVRVFQDKLYILATFGLKESGGYDVRMRNIERGQDGFLVDVLYVEPSPGQYTFPAFTRPFDLVSINLDEYGLPPQLLFTYEADENEFYPPLPTRLEP